MADRLISLAAGVLPEFAPEQMAAAAVAAGWPAVGIWVDPTTWTAATAREVRARVADAGIAVLDVEVIWLKPGGDDADHFRIVDAGAAIRARNVLAVSSETDPGAAAARLARLADHAEAAGLRLSLEFAAFTEVKSLAEARAILDRAGDGVGLMVDPLHLARTGGTPAMLAAVDPRRFAYAQICCAAAAGRPPRATSRESSTRRSISGCRSARARCRSPTCWRRCPRRRRSASSCARRRCATPGPMPPTVPARCSPRPGRASPRSTARAERPA